LIARSEYGLMVQILGGLITYLLMAISARVKQVVAFAVLCSNFSAQSPHDLRRVI
jgi:hypothetical protein